MSRNLQAELAALRRINGRVSRELYQHDRRDDTPSDRVERRFSGETEAAGAEGVYGRQTSPAWSPNGARMEHVVPHRHVQNGVNGAIPRQESSSSPEADEAILRLEEDLRILTGAVERMIVAVSEDLRLQNQTLTDHIEQVDDEIQRLRLELGHRRPGEVAKHNDEPAARRQVVLHSLEPREHEIIMSHPIDALRRRFERPWYYIPFFFGIVVLGISLVASLYLTM